MKSRCMSMMRRAVADQSRTIGSGSAATVPLVRLIEFAICTHPRRESPRNQLSKAHAIVYNAFGHRDVRKSFIFSAGWFLNRVCLFPVRRFCDGHLLIH